MGKGKKQKREKKERAGESNLDKANDVKEMKSAPASSSPSDKDTKKSNKKFGLSLLRQAKEGRWEGHELGKLALLISETIPLKKEKFINFLVKSEVINSQMIAGLQDEGFDFGSSSLILDILYNQSENKQKFIAVYQEALDNTLFSVKDSGLIVKLADITQRSQFSRGDIVHLLKVSCSHSETLKCCGQLLACFCKEIMESQALFYIVEGTLPSSCHNTFL